MKRKAMVCLAMMLLIMIEVGRLWAVDIIKALPPATQQLTLEMIRTATKAPGSPSPGALVPVTGRGPNGKLVQGTGQVPWAAIALMVAGSAVWVWDNWDAITSITDVFTGAGLSKGTETHTFTAPGASPGNYSTNTAAQSNYTGLPSALGYPTAIMTMNESAFANNPLITAFSTSCCYGGTCGTVNKVTSSNTYWDYRVDRCERSGSPNYMVVKGWVSPKAGGPAVGTVTAIAGGATVQTTAQLVTALQTYAASNEANQTKLVAALNQLTANMVAQTVGQPAASTPNVTTGVNDTPVPTGYSFPGSPATAGQNFVYQWYINAPTTYTDITNQAGDTTVTNVIPETDTSWLSKLLEWLRNAIGLGESPPDSGGIPPTDHGADEGDPTPGENEKQILMIPDDPDPDAEPMGPTRGAVQAKQNTFLANLLGELVDLTSGFRSEVSGLISGMGSGSAQCSMTAEVFGVSVPIDFCQINFGSLSPIITTMFCVACLLIIIGG